MVKRTKKHKEVKHSYNEALEPEEKKVLINTIHEYSSSNRLHHLALIYLMLNAGLRVSEALQFRRSWFIKKDKGYIIKIPSLDKDITNLRKSWQPKTPKGAREIPVFEEWLNSFLDVFLVNNKRIKLNRQNAYKIIKKYGSMIGRPKLHPHALRSTRANELVDLGVSPRNLMHVMGWAKLETANSYISGTPRSARKQLEEIYIKNGKN